MTTSTVDLRPAKLNVKMVRGDTVGYLIQVNDAAAAPVDLTGRTYAAQLRRSPNSSTAVDVEVDTTAAATGQLVLRLAAVTTATLSGDYDWDLQQTLGGTVRTLLAGRWTFEPDTTRSA